jgi:hypothetical protein
MENFKVVHIENTNPKLKISVGPCKIAIRPADIDSWAEGSYHDPSGQIPLKLEKEGDEASISHGKDFGDYLNIFKGAPEMDLKLAKGKPFRLKLKSGAGDCNLDLGGLPIKDFVIKQGAGQTKLTFSARNPEVMDSLEFKLGAGNLVASHLLNANFKRLLIEGGAGSYSLGFEGELVHEATVEIKSAVSSTDVYIPKGIAVKVLADRALGSVDMPKDFIKQDIFYQNQQALDGKQPTLTIHASVAVGSISIKYL